MKYKKYLLVLMIAMLFNASKILADENPYYHEAMCYYKSESKDVSAKIRFVTTAKTTSQYGPFETIGHVNVMRYHGSRNRKGTVKNIGESWRHGGITFEAVHVTAFGLDDGTVSCPAYAIITNVGNNVVLTNDESVAQNGVSAFSNGAEYAPAVSADEFWNFELCNGKDGGCEIGQDVKISCEDNTLFGDVDDKGGYCMDIILDGSSCPSGRIAPPSMAYTINKFLSYIRIIVPILIIILGSLDLAKAVLAGKPDEMKKAQVTFFKRIIAGVCVFLAPIFINVLMSLADVAWQGTGYETCKPEIILKK